MDSSEITARAIMESIPGRFIPEKAGDMSAVMHFDIKGDEDGGQWTVTVANGTVKLEEGLVGECTSSVSGKAKDFIAVELGKLNPAMALMMGKAKVKNLNEMLRFKGCFNKYTEDVAAG